MKPSQVVEKNDLNKQTKKVRKNLKKTNAENTLDKHTGKKETNSLATGYLDEILSPKALERFGECGDFLRFAITAKKNKSKVIYGNFCKNRFCPMCNMRTAIKEGYAIGLSMNHLEEQNYRFAFLTLTVRNCKAEELSCVLDQMNHAAKKMFERARIRGAVKGYIRKIEVTYNGNKTITKADFKKREEYYTSKGLSVGMDNPVYDTYHPHMHFILVLDESYFVKHSKTYIAQAEWLKNWQEVNGTERVGLDIRKLKSESESNAVKEIAKYSAKDSDLYASQTAFLTFYFSLKGRRLLTFSGVAKDSRKAFKKGELDYIKEREHDERRTVQENNKELPDIFVDLLRANWTKRITKNQRKVQEYALAMNELSADEFVKANNEKDVELAMKILEVDNTKELIEKIKEQDKNQS